VLPPQPVEGVDDLAFGLLGTALPPPDDGLVAPDDDGALAGLAFPLP
jgi:hypothetical protein